MAPEKVSTTSGKSSEVFKEGFHKFHRKNPKGFGSSFGKDFPELRNRFSRASGKKSGISGKEFHELLFSSKYALICLLNCRFYPDLGRFLRYLTLFVPQRRFCQILYYECIRIISQCIGEPKQKFREHRKQLQQLPEKALRISMESSENF